MPFLRTRTRHSYSSVGNTGTRVMFINFIQFITVGKFPARCTDASEVFLG